MQSSHHNTEKKDPPVFGILLVVSALTHLIFFLIFSEHTPEPEPSRIDYISVDLVSVAPPERKPQPKTERKPQPQVVPPKKRVTTPKPAQKKATPAAPTAPVKKPLPPQGVPAPKASLAPPKRSTVQQYGSRAQPASTSRRPSVAQQDKSIARDISLQPQKLQHSETSGLLENKISTQAATAQPSLKNSGEDVPPDYTGISQINGADQPSPDALSKPRAQPSENTTEKDATAQAATKKARAQTAHVRLPADRRLVYRPEAPVLKIEDNTSIRLRFLVKPSGEVFGVAPMKKGNSELERVGILLLMRYRFEEIPQNQIQEGLITLTMIQGELSEQ